MSTERKRAENFSAAQRDFIIDFIQENRIIESKEATVKVTSMKQKVWKNLTASFNSKFNSTKATIQLKTYWKGLKSNTKKSIAVSRREAHVTGGGSSNAPRLSVAGEQIAEIISLDLNPLPNNYDGDASVTISVEDLDDDDDDEIEETLILPATSKTPTKKAFKRSVTSFEFYELAKKRLQIEERKAIAQEEIAQVFINFCL